MTRPESMQGRNTIAALVVAAGSGARMGGDMPKQYRLLAGIPVLTRSLLCFLDHPRIDVVLPVISPGAEKSCRQATSDIARYPALKHPVAGSDTRQKSVLAGLEALAADAPDLVLIADAARPFVSRGLIDRTIAALESGNVAALPALAVTDTLKKSDADGNVAATVPRDGMFRAQTPQGFHFESILAAHRGQIGEAHTDDAAVAEAAGLAVRLVDGEIGNTKLTTPEDLVNAEAMLRTPGTGIGYDVHRLVAGDGMMLCGVYIPHDRALDGHSDADVGLHALTDAVLGAIGAGDIGDHFPPGDPQWAGVSSDRFLARAAALVREKGGRIVHVDVTLICESPKIGPHKSIMRQRIADILGIDAGSVSVKATTTERLGFTGRGEGIAAQAVATVLL